MLPRTKIRAAVLSVVAFLAAALFTAVPAQPAHADAATSCLHPSVSGTITKTWTPSIPAQPRFRYDNLVGTAPASCTYTPFSFSTYRYEYKVSFYYWWTERVSVEDSSITSSGGTSTIAFPATTSPRVSQAPHIGVRIDAYRYNLVWGGSPVVETQRYIVNATAGTTTSFNTATMAEVYECFDPEEVEGQIPMGKIAMCP